MLRWPHWHWLSLLLVIDLLCCDPGQLALWPWMVVEPSYVGMWEGGWEPNATNWGLNATNVTYRSLDERVQVAAITCAFSNAKTRSQRAAEVDAEYDTLQWSRPVVAGEWAAMRSAMEKRYGHLEDKIYPSKEFVEKKLAEIEGGEYRAEDLTEVVSKEEIEPDGVVPIWDSKGRLAMRKASTKVPEPANAEELRRRLSIWKNAMVMISLKHSNRHELQGAWEETVEQYKDYLLGDYVYGLSAKDAEGQTFAAPPWKLVIAYEKAIRKQAVKLTNTEGKPLTVALKMAWKDATVKERNFTTPLALYAKRPLPPWREQPAQKTPSIFEEQVKWNLEGEVGSDAVLQKENYSSAAEHERYLVEHLEQEVSEGLMIKMKESEFIEAFGENRAVAALAVLVEDELTGKKRVIHDGTHGVMVNHRIKCRDKVRMPGPREKRALLEEYEAGRQVILSLVGDFAKAHRRFKYAGEEQGFLACKASSTSETVYINQVGTFGVASTPYWWARLSAALMRTVYWVLGDSFPDDMLLYADDLEVLAVGREGRVGAVLAFSLMAALGAPFKWAKQRGGLTSEWIGLTTDYRTFSMGLSERRAGWLIDWIGSLRLRKEDSLHFLVEVDRHKEAEAAAPVADLRCPGGSSSWERLDRSKMLDICCANGATKKLKRLGCPWLLAQRLDKVWKQFHVASLWSLMLGCALGRAESDTTDAKQALEIQLQDKKKKKRPAIEAGHAITAGFLEDDASVDGPSVADIKKQYRPAKRPKNESPVP
eukprot:g19239.t1